MISLPNAVALVIICSTVSYVFGHVQRNRWHEDRATRLEENLRLLYFSTGFMYPAEPEPSPSWWSRLGGWWERKTRPVSVIPEPAPAANDTELADQDDSGDESFPEVFTDPEPATDEIPAVPGPETRPSAAVIAADWEARQAQLMAEFQAAADEISGVKR